MYRSGWVYYLLLFIIPFLSACKKEAPQFLKLSDLEGGKSFAVPTGTVADQFVLDRFPDAKLLYYNTVLDCALAVKSGLADAAIYDLPVLKNIASKNEGLTVLDELLTPDDFGFAVNPGNRALKEVIDQVVSAAKADGLYHEMMERWFPDQGEPGPMPTIESSGDAGILLFGTAAITEPLSYYNKDRQITGFDIELALRVAKKLNKRLEIIDLEFGALLPALISGKVDMIGAGMSITEERAKSVLFSESYYKGGIAALVRTSDVATSVLVRAKDLEPDNHGLMHVIDDIAGKRVGIFTGTVHDAFLTTHYPTVKVSRFEQTGDMILSLKTGKIDAAMFDLITAKLVLKRNPELGLLSDDVFETPLGVGFNKNNPALLKEFNDFLREIMEDGTHAQMVERWMVNDPESAVMPDFVEPATGKKLTVGVSVEDLPYVAYMNGQFVGFDIEMMRLFAQRRNYKLELVVIEFPALVAALASGKVDLITDGISISEERARQINFSDEYAMFRTGVIALKKNLAKYQDQSLEVEITPFFKKVADSFYNNIIREKRYRLILNGLLVTILISVFAAIFGTVLGGIVCFMRMSKTRLLNNVASLYISLIRGTPVLVLLMIIYYVIFASWNINPILVAVIAFGINFAAYVSEMFRSSIQSIDNGQNEAGIASGFTKIQTFIHIIMPQALQRVLPVYKGEFISLLKMTSIVGYIAVQDLTKASDIIRSRTFDAFFPLIMAAIIYIFLAWFLTIVLDRIEIGIDPKKRRTKMMKEVIQ